MKKLTFLFVVMFGSFVLSTGAIAVNEVKTIGSTGADYATLKAAFDAINAGTLTGNITLQIIGSTTEPPSGTIASLNASGSGSASFTSVLIYPTVANCTINCANTNGWPVVTLNGADHVTIDGRVNQTGSTPSLTIANSVRIALAFNNGSCNNVIKYCTLKGSYNGLSSAGVISFNNTGGGNMDNIIENCNITNGGTRMCEALRSVGASGNINSGNIIRNNNIYDIFSTTNTSKEVIYLGNYNENWTIQGNSFYETSDIVPGGSGDHIFIAISGTYSGGLYSISGNYIGGTAPQCGGTALTKTDANTNPLYAISLSQATGCTISIQGNVIRNIAWSNAGAAYGFLVGASQGCALNVGTETGNIFGDTVGSGSVTFTNGGDAMGLICINVNTNGDANISNNSFGSIKTNNSNSTFRTDLFVISKGNYTGNITVSNNRIGSTDPGTSNSIWAASASTASNQYLFGMNTESATSSWTITGNTFSKVTNSSTATQAILDFVWFSKGASNVITSNVIRDLTSSSSSTGSSWQTSVCGINLSGGFSGTQTISDNTIFNFVNDNGSFAGNVIGISCEATTTSTLVISGNYVHSLNATGASLGAAKLIGIKAGGNAVSAYNNLLVLGNNTKTEINGFYDVGGTLARTYLFNTVYIYGSSGSATQNSMAFACSPGTGAKDFRNNVFVNARSGLSGSYHYAYYISYSNGTLTSDYNDYYVSGTGGTLGYFQYNRLDLSQIQAGTGGDTHSQAVNPSFANAGSLVDTSYRVTNDLAGVSGTGILTDYEGIARASTPTMGAFQWSPVSTQAVTSITSTSATGNGTITKAGTFTNRGCIVYEYSGTDKVIGDAGVSNSSSSGSFSPGVFTAGLPGLTPGTRYNVRAHTTKSGITYYGNRLDFYSLCNVPAAPTVGNPMAASLDVTIDVNSNPASTMFCINETSTGQFVQANGKLGATEVWKTASEWGTKRVSGLTLGNTYIFKVKARNGANVETAYGASASGTTSVMPVVRTGIITWQEGNLYDDATVWDVLAFAGNGQNAFASSYYGTTYRYDNGAWTPSNTTPGYAYLRNMAISNDGSVALAGGDNNMNIYSAGVWTSTSVPGLNSHVWNCIAVAGDGSKMLAGATNGRIYIYSGGAWSETQPAGAVDKYWNSADMSDDGSVIMAAVGYTNAYPAIGGRVYLSMDGGTSWSEIRPDGDLDHVWDGVSVSHDGNVLFAVYQGSNHVFKSTDGGATWTSENPNPPYAADINWRKIDASYDGSRVAISDMSGPLYYYSDGTWSKDFAPISCCSGDISLTADGERMIVSNNSRTYMSFYGDAISNITFTSATATGTIINIGGPAASQHGFVWSSTVPVPTIALTTKTQEGVLTNTGTFRSQVTGLTANTLYYIRAYATNANGTVYGDVTTFRTGTFRYVDQAKTGGANNGSSWADAFTDLYSALNVAGEGDHIWVAKGTYKPQSGTTPRDSSFIIPNGVQVCGGFAGNEANLADRNWENNVTILSGDIGTEGTNTDNVYHVVRFSLADSATLLDGFTVTKGYANGGASLDTDDPGNHGGGIYNDGSGAGKSSNPRISHCIIRDNYANYRGGGIYNESNIQEDDTKAGEASPSFSNCNFQNNSTDNNGGAVYNEGVTGGIASPSFNNCTFTSNSAGFTGGAVNNTGIGTGTSSPIFTSCSFTSNSSSNDGGAINSDAYDGATNTPALISCTFTNNHSNADGGAVYNYSGSGGIANASIDLCTFTGNTADSDAGAIMNEVYDAGGVSSPAITNCLFTNNETTSTDGKGGALLNQGYPGTCSPVISSCHFISNSADRGGAICNYGRDDSGDDGISSPTITNCTFKGNSTNGTSGYGGAIYNYGRSGGETSPVVTNCLFSGNAAKKGSAIYNNDGSAEFVNCTMSGNYASVSGTFFSAGYTNSSDPQISNCIIWHNNDVAVVNGTDGNPVFHYSDIEGSGGSSSWNPAFGTDVGYNIDSDPVFASRIILTPGPTTAGDLRLTAASPCADAGQDSYISETFDIRGTGFGRFLLKSDSTQTGPVDMGAYEYKQGFDPLSPAPSLLTAPVTIITTAGGDCGGRSIQDNGAPITEKGIVWSYNANPVITDQKLIFTPADTAAFTVTISAALPSTAVHVRAFATNAGGTAYGDDVLFITLAKVPDAPTVENLNPGNLKVTVNPNGNPATTEFAIQEQGGKFVQDDGSLGVTATWNTISGWGTKTITGLTAGTEYGFSVKARNGDLAETAYSDTVYGTPLDVPLMGWISIDKIAGWTAIRPSNHWYISVSGDGSTVIAACGRLNVSTDQGNSWTNLEPTGNNDGGWGLPALSHTGDTILVGAFTQSGRLWRSYDKGSTWSEIRPAGTNKDYKWYGLSVSENGTFMYVTRTSGSEANVTFRSADAGVTWTALPTGMFPTNGSGSSGTVFSSDNSIQYMAGSGIYKSTDYGVTWSSSLKTGTLNYPNVSSDGQVVTLKSWDNKYYRSADGGSSWSEFPVSGTGLSIAMSEDAKILLTINASNPANYSNDSGVTWKSMEISMVNPTWQNVTMSNDGKVMYVASYNYTSYGNNGCYRADMGAFKPITDTSATATANLASLSGTSESMVRGAIYYEYTNTDKQLGEPGVFNWSESGTFGEGTYTFTLDGLSPGTHYNSRAYATNDVGPGYSPRTHFWTLPLTPPAPTVDNPAAHSLDVTLNTNLNGTGTEYAIYDTATAKYVQDNGSLGNSAVWKTIADWGTKSVTGLATGATYRFKVKARNGDQDETPFGPGASGTTIATPSVSTQAASSVTATEVTGNARIDTVYSLDVTNRGLIIYPYTNTNKVIGAADVTNHDTTGVFGVGAFTRSLTGLTPNVRYNIRGHATNINGTSYGARLDFWTLANIPLPPFAGNATAVSLEVAVKPNGNSAATLFLIQDSVAGLYLQPDGSRTATQTWQTAAQWDTVTVTGLSTGVTYYFRAKAKSGNNTETAWSVATGANTCSDPTDGGTIGTAQSVCLTVIPDSLTSLIEPSGYGGALAYRWQSSTVNAVTGFSDINGATHAGYQPPTLTDTAWYRRLVHVSCKPDWSGAVSSNVIEIACYPYPFTISGVVRYDNNPKTPLNGLKVFLRKGSAVIDSVVTTSSGNYLFNNLYNGSYGLIVRSAHPSGQWQTWGGVNMTDYLLTLKHATTGPLLVSAPPVIRIAGDVKVPQNPPLINTADASAIQMAAKYGWGNPPYFQIPKWVFSGTTAAMRIDTFDLACTSVTREIRGLCAGDVNGTYLPWNGFKIAGQGLTLENRGVMAIREEMTFPLGVSCTLPIGAFTFILNYDPVQIEITGVDMQENAGTPPWFLAGNGILSIGWASLEPVVMQMGQPLLKIRARLVGVMASIRFTLNETIDSELADGDGNVMEGVKLWIPVAAERLHATPLPNGITVYPNPAHETLNIEFESFTNGILNLEVVNLQGVAVLKGQPAIVKTGWYKSQVDVRKLLPGVYFLRVAWNGEMVTKKVLITR